MLTKESWSWWAPTQESVDAMVAAMGLPKDHVVGVLQPSGAEIRILEVAVNAVLAGCLPEYGPVVLAAVKGVLDERFAGWGIACSTKGCAPLVIVNGPIRQSIKMNCHGAVFGSGNRANATIGRAVRLVLQNVGGAKTPNLDRSTLGHGGKYTYCIAEDEEGSPWEPLHVERGLSPEKSAVTLLGGEAPRLITMVTNSAEAILYAAADTISCVGLLGLDFDVSHNWSKPYLFVFAKEHRDVLKAEGWTKDKIKEFLIKNAVIPVERLRRAGIDMDKDAPMLHRKEDIFVVAAGGSAGPFSCVVPGWSWMSQPITVPIEN
jgi:hypothetical protein